MQAPNLPEAFGGRRAICLLCSTGFRVERDCDPQICADCVAFEPGPFQDNDAPAPAIWHGPLQAPEIVIAQRGRREAERGAAQAFTALLLLHEALTAISGQKGRPLRLLPRDQSKRARLALEMFRENFPDLAEALDDLPVTSESLKLGGYAQRGERNGGSDSNRSGETSA